MRKVNAYAAHEPSGQLTPYQYELGALPKDEIEIKVHYCGICHSDLSMLNDDWRRTQYPFVPGHEIIGEVVGVGSCVDNFETGTKVGLGWISFSCLQCAQCIEGQQHLCGSKKETIVGRHGGFADYVRCHWSWAIPLPEGIDMSKAGPLMCGGITVFNPVLAGNVRPTDRVGVIGIGGLGHMAIKMLNKWGCDVTAFSTSPDKTNAILSMGAHRVVNSRDKEAMKLLKGQLDFILNTTNVVLNWNAYLGALAPKGTFHMVGVLTSPMELRTGFLMSGERKITGNPTGSPGQIRKMLEFCTRHGIYPDVEQFPLTKVNQAMAHLKSGKARYRIVLDIAK